MNRDLKHGWLYHDSTKHSYQSVRSNAHFLDWPNKPLDFKVYSDLEPIPLPQKLRPSGVPALEAIATPEVAGEGELDLGALAQVLHLTAGITRRRRYPGGEILFRAAACTGALYQFELYVVSGELPNLAAGVYHFAPRDVSLRRLRAGDYRGELALERAAAIIIFAGTYWRNAWKYQARAYRHLGWDNGTMLANLLAAAVSLRLPAKIFTGFVDAEVNALLGLDTAREVAFSMLALGNDGRKAQGRKAQAGMPVPRGGPVPQNEVDYPAMREMHAASSLASSEEVAAWRSGPELSIRPGAGAAETPSPPAVSGGLVPLQPRAEPDLPPDPVEEVILRRGSSRAFAREPITFAELSTILDRATRGIPSDFSENREQWNHLYVVAHAVDGLPPGAYYFHRDRTALECLKLGDFRRTSGYLGLEQELPADSSAAVFFLADLNAVFARFGNRGYRAVQLEAGILGGKLYLAAYAMRLGATGLTFYDDEVVAFFSPHAQGKSAIFLTALGHSAKHRPVL